MKLDRRDLTDAELVFLFDFTRTARPSRKLPGLDREMLYLVSVYTGLRASELASLMPESFRLGDRPTVTVAAAYSKHRREDVLPLHHDIVPRLSPSGSRGGRPASGCGPASGRPRTGPGRS